MSGLQRRKFGPGCETQQAACVYRLFRLLSVTSKLKEAARSELGGKVEVHSRGNWEASYCVFYPPFEKAKRSLEPSLRTRQRTAHLQARKTGEETPIPRKAHFTVPTLST